MRFSQKRLPSESAAIAVATLLPLLLPILCSAQQLTPAEALDRYLAMADGSGPASSDSVFTVQIDASLPTLHKQGSMTGLKLVSYTGQVVYRGLRFTGDKLVKTAVIAHFLSNDTNPAVRTADVAVSRQNYWFTYNKISDYNGLTAYVFLLKPRRIRVGLFRGELWLTTDTAAPLRLWGDLVKSPSIFIRSFRFCAGLPNGCGVLAVAPPGADNPHANCRHGEHGRMAAFRRRLAGIYWRRRE